ncbi:MAG: XcyI family restriction endonuclease [Planctomycetota bacterium]|jgi:hypothetical protein
MGTPKTTRTLDKHLIAALTKAYMARAQLFHRGVRASKIDLLIAEIDGIDEKSLDWAGEKLGISQVAIDRVKEAGGAPHQVFAHPQVIVKRPHLIGYYRNIVTISKKGIDQILFSTEGYESRRKKEIANEDAVTVCRTLNRILSGVIEKLPDYTVELSRQAILAEIGTELQGTWANVIGRGAAKAVEGLLGEYIATEELGRRLKDGGFKLDNGWTIIFANEPDVALFDAAGVKRIAVEIKGSLDKAGAQTRYGEAKKSFAKQLSENPRCHTVYLASCFTDAVIEQIKQDGQVREWFNLTSILYDEAERQRFLNRLFHIVKTPT